jgi:hypothetical protein
MYGATVGFLLFTGVCIGSKLETAFFGGEMSFTVIALVSALCLLCELINEVHKLSKHFNLDDDMYR